MLLVDADQPRRGTGAKTAERAPTTTRASPATIALALVAPLGLGRAPSAGRRRDRRSARWKRASVCGVSAISGTSTIAPRPRASALRTRGGRPRSCRCRSRRQSRKWPPPASMRLDDPLDGPPAWLRRAPPAPLRRPCLRSRSSAARRAAGAASARRARARAPASSRSSRRSRARGRRAPAAALDDRLDRRGLDRPAAPPPRSRRRRPRRGAPKRIETTAPLPTSSGTS